MKKTLIVLLSICITCVSLAACKKDVTEPESVDVVYEYEYVSENSNSTDNTDTSSNGKKQKNNIASQASGTNSKTDKTTNSKLKSTAKESLSPAVSSPSSFSGVSYMNYYTKRSSFNNTIYRLQNDKNLKIAYIGGSVTDGTGAQTANACWREKVGNWFCKAFPNADIENIRASVGGTGSGFGMYRIDSDLLQKNVPDLVFVEFSVNDNFQKYTESEVKCQIETIYKKIYSKNPYAEIVMIYVTDNGRGNDNVVKWHESIAEKYKINAIFLNDLIYDYMDKEGKEFSYYFADGVHPNDKGYAVYSNGIIAVLQSEICGNSDEKIEKKLPNASSALKMNANLYKATSATQIKTTGFKKDTSKFSWLGNVYGGSISADTSDCTVTICFKGTDLGILWEMGPDIGSIEYTVDGKSTYKANGYLDYSNPVELMLAKNLESGEHTVKIRTVDSKKKYAVSAILVAGELL